MWSGTALASGHFVDLPQPNFSLYRTDPVVFAISPTLFPSSYFSWPVGMIISSIPPDYIYALGSYARF